MRKSGDSSSNIQTDRTKVLIRVSEIEKARLIEKAADAEVTLSSYLRCVATGVRLRSQRHYQRVQSTVAVRGDVGRYGGLLKLWLSVAPKTDGFDRAQIIAVLKRTELARDAVKGLLRRVMRAGRGPDGVTTATGSRLERGHRNRTIQAYITCIERQQLRERAAAAGESLSSFVRTRALSFQPYEGISQGLTDGLTARRDQLRPLGDLLKMFLFDAIELGKFPPSQVQAAVRGSLLAAAAELTAIIALAESPSALQAEERARS